MDDVKEIPPLLSSWFLSLKRPLPWRESPTPYSVWVSEVMLQQTQASVVIPYFLRWMERFPTLEALANASLEEVLKLWEGLGYYSRARSLHEGARYVVEKWGGVLPKDRESLSKIKGVGPYTVGAIRAFAFKMKASAIDGNVVRVASRLFAISECVDLPKIRNRIASSVDALLPEREPWVFAEALIELGATVCKKIPLCAECPVRQYCKAKRGGIEQTLPLKRERQKTILLKRHLFCLLAEGAYLVRQVPKGEVMAGLYEFPYLEEGEEPEEWLMRHRIEAKELFRLPSVSHTFTRYKALLTPVLYSARFKSVPEGYCLMPAERLQELPFSSGHRKLLQSLLLAS